MRIRKDQSRFKKIIKGQIRKNLKKYVSAGSLIGKVGKNKVSIPVPNINIPRFRFDDQQSGGIGQGDGQPGDPINGNPKQGKTGEAGQGDGENILEVEISIDELADIIGEELQLPNIEPKGNKNISDIHHRYTGINKEGSEGLKHFKRTYKEALKRQISIGTYNYNNPIIIPQKRDHRYKTPKDIIEPRANAVIIYMMDVSGSMGSNQKEIVRTTSFWIDTWLSKQYKGLETRFIVHTSKAREVQRDDFFKTKESGGTEISSALTKAIQIIESEYNPTEWNIYAFYFSDGDNYSYDNDKCIQLLKDKIIPYSNMFAYGQVDSLYGDGSFFEILKNAFKNEPRVVLSQIKERDEILGCIKTFLGKGH